MYNAKRQRLMEGIKSLLTQNAKEDHFFQYNGKAYTFEQIDFQTWQPKPTAQGITREFKRTQIMLIGNLKIHF